MNINNEADIHFSEIVKSESIFGECSSRNSGDGNEVTSSVNLDIKVSGFQDNAVSDFGKTGSFVDSDIKIKTEHFPEVVKSESVFGESSSRNSCDRTEVTSSANLDEKMSGSQDNTVSDFEKTGSFVDSDIKIKTEYFPGIIKNESSPGESSRMNSGDETQVPSSVNPDAEVWDFKDNTVSDFKIAGSSIDSGVKIKTEHFPEVVKSESVFGESSSRNSCDRTEVTSSANLDEKMSGSQDNTVSDFEKTGSFVDSDIKIKTEYFPEIIKNESSPGESSRMNSGDETQVPSSVNPEAEVWDFKDNTVSDFKIAGSSIDSGVKIKTEIEDEIEFTHGLVGVFLKSEECGDEKSFQDVKCEINPENIKKESYDDDFKPCFNDDAAPFLSVNEQTTIKTEEEIPVGSQTRTEIDHRSSTAKLMNVSVVLEDLFPSHLRKLGQMHFNTPSCSCIYCRGEYSCSSDSKPRSKNRQGKKQPSQVQNSSLKSGQKRLRRVNSNPDLKVKREETLFQCEECSFECDSKSALNAHAKKHKMRKTYKCKLCTKRFPQMSLLLSHAKEHDASKPFKCDECPARFWFESFLQSHLRVHYRKRRYRRRKNVFVERPVKCPLCLADFRHKANLNWHMRTHWNVKTKRRQKSKTCQEDLDWEPEQNADLNVDSSSDSEEENATEVSDEEKPASCTVPNNLNWHMRTHWNKKTKRRQKSKTCQEDFDWEPEQNADLNVDSSSDSEEENATEVSDEEKPASCTAPNDACSCLPCYLTRKSAVLADHLDAGNSAENFFSNPS